MQRFCLFIGLFLLFGVIAGFLTDPCAWVLVFLGLNSGSDPLQGDPGQVATWLSLTLLICKMG